MEVGENSMSTKIKKFDFSKLDFDVLREREQQEAIRRRQEIERLRIEEDVALNPPPIVFSEEEHETAIKDAFEKGKAEGLKQATLEQNQQILDLVKVLVPQIQKLCDSENERCDYFEKSSVKMAVSIAKKMIPQLFKTEAANEIESFLFNTIKSERINQQIKIFIAESLREIIQERIHVMFDDKSYATGIAVIGVEGVPIDSCRIEWGNDGGVERNTNKILTKIEKITECYFHQEKTDNSVSTLNIDSETEQTKQEN